MEWVYNSDVRAYVLDTPAWRGVPSTFVTPSGMVHTRARQVRLRIQEKFWDEAFRYRDDPDRLSFKHIDNLVLVDDVDINEFQGGFAAKGPHDRCSVSIVPRLPENVLYSVQPVVAYPFLYFVGPSPVLLEASTQLKGNMYRVHMRYEPICRDHFCQNRSIN